MDDYTSEHEDPDELDRELAATDDVLQRSLAQLLTAPADLESRTQSQVTTSLLARSMLGTGADLLTVGWQTVRLLFTDPLTDPPTDPPTGPETDDHEEVTT